MSGDGAQTIASGLTEADAQARLKAEGYNELPRREARSFVAIILDVIREPMMALLLLGGLLYLLLGDLSEALVLLIFASISTVITIVQETRTERVLEALRDLTSPRAVVVRDGVPSRIPGREVVRGDLLVLEEGGRIPADGRLVQAHDLAVDESLLTGESVPVQKSARHDDVFSGTLAVRGGGMAEVTATGAASRIGRIGQSLNTIIPEPPRMRAETRRLVRIFGAMALVVCTLFVLLYGLVRGGWLKAVLNGIALGMSMLPEEFPMVLAIFTAMGAWRISRAHVLTRNAGAIETLGAATVLCTDKTGTLTENRMSVAELCLPDGAFARPQSGLDSVFLELAEFSRLASARQPFDPMEMALHSLSPADGPDRRRLLRTYGVRPGLMAMSQAWEEPSGHVTIASKGAPEAVAELCALPEEDRRRLHEQAGAMAAEGLRVLAVAKAGWDEAVLPKTQQGFAFTLLGLVGLADPLRAAVPDSVCACAEAGIRVIMITGDYPETAQAIGRQAGLPGAEVVTGAEVERLDDDALGERVRTAAIFARITPEQKLRIVQALKRGGAVVAMTGDGVNDAPSLKAAHIGVAMGGRGTDVAREAAALVVLDDDFSSIVTAIRLGRRIHDNLRKAMCFIVAVHVPIAAFALGPLLFGMPLLLGPVHIALLEMVIDPVCALVFENEPDERDIMRRPPNPPQAPLLPASLLTWGGVQGTVVFILTALIYLFMPRHHVDETDVRTLTFVALMANVLVLTLVNRSYSTSVLRAFRRPNPMLAVVAGLIAGVMMAALAWPAARQVLSFGQPRWEDVGVVAPAALGCLVVLEALKWFWVKALRR